MGRVIRPQLAARDIEADLRNTLSRANLGPPEVADAGERFLKNAVARCKALRREWQDAEEAALDARSAFTAADRRARAMLGKVWDDLFNRIGRRRGHVQFQLIFPDGAIRVMRCREELRAHRVRLVALRLETVELGQVSEAYRRGLARKVREAAEALAARHAEKLAAASSAKDARSTYVGVARNGATLLSRFKKHLAGEGISEAEIHEYIPHRPRTSKRAQEEAETGGAAEAAEARDEAEEPRAAERDPDWYAAWDDEQPGDGPRTTAGDDDRGG